MAKKNNNDLATYLGRLRERLDSAFSPETARKGYSSEIASSGHCAAVALIVRSELGGEIVSVAAGSHWFNRIVWNAKAMDVDITADQFGKTPVLFGAAGSIWPNPEVESLSDLEQETVERAKVLAARAGLTDIQSKLAQLAGI